MPPVITDKDLGYNKLVRGLLAADDMAVTMGIQGAEAQSQPYEGSDATLAKVAGTQEFGHKQIPERSFLRSTMDAKAATYGRMMARLMRKVVRTKGTFTPHQALGVLGAKSASHIKQTINRSIPPALAPATIRWRLRTNESAAKKFNRGKRKKGLGALGVAIRLAASFRPLINTGVMKNAVSFKVRRRFKGGRAINE